MAALKTVADPGIVAILGTDCSVAAIPTARIMSEAGLAMISGANTLPSLTSVAGEPGAEWQPGYFRTAYNDVDQGRAAATFAFEELGARRSAVVHDGDPYAEGLTKVFAQVFTELGGEVVVTTGVNKGDRNMQPLLSAVRTAGAEFLFSPVFSPEAIHIVVQAQEFQGLRELAIMTTYANQSIVETVGTAGIGVYFVGPTTPKGTRYESLVARYRARYGEAPIGTYHAQTYDAANLLLSAIAAVAVPEDSGALHIGREALREQLYATRDFEGLTGRLDCDAFGDCGAVRFDVLRLEDPSAGLAGLTNNVVYSYSGGASSREDES